MTFLSVVAVLLILAIILKLANPLPSRTSFPADLEIPQIESESEIAQAATLQADQYPDKTGHLLLSEGIDAFAMRLALVRSAERTVDARYYIWEGDLSGKMLLSAIIEAADRGVRVRLLIDDNPTAGLDKMWAAANSHPNISVRLFNPLVIRRFRPLNYLFDFPRLNRRMHNKSLTVDDAATIIGGRNIGDAYFGAKTSGLFVDLDTLAIGSAVPAVASDFERYWTSDASFPAETILAGPSADGLSQLREPKYDDAALSREYLMAANEAIITLGFKDQSASFEWAPTLLVSDNPDKALNKAKQSDLLAAQIAPLIQNAKSSFDLVSGYFVPGEKGTELIETIARRKVKTRVVTNGYAVTDVPIVHAGYISDRPQLVEAGVQLYEARPLRGDKNASHKLGQTKFSGGGESVHAKTFAIDGKHMFIGSFNFDPRSALLNCEMGFIIESPQLATAFAQALDSRVMDHAYHVTINSDKKLEWQYVDGDKLVGTTTEPSTTFFSRTMIRLLSLLPIQWML